jgi:hypothetical protein
MKIIVSGQATACHARTGEIIADASLLRPLHGLRYDEDLGANYLYDDLLNDISVVGGAIELVFDPDSGNLRVISEYWSPSGLNVEQLQALADHTLGQWSDGIGEGCFDEWSRQTDIDLDLAPFASDCYQPPTFEQVDDGREVPRFAHLAKAVWNEKVEVVRQAVAEKADLNAVYDGHTALLLAIHRKNVSIVMLLIEGGANVNLASVTGTTPLMACVSLSPADSITVARALLANGADLSPQDHLGRTASAIATDSHQPELAALLRE